MGITKGNYTRDMYFIPTVSYHNGDGWYKTVEVSFLKWYIGICWHSKEALEYLKSKEDN